MHTRQKSLALLLGVLMFTIMPLAVAADAKAVGNHAGTGTRALPVAAQTGGVSVPVAGTTQKGGKFNGSFRVKEFAVVDNQIVAVGTLTGTIQNGAGNVLGTVLRTIALPVVIGQAECDILHLELGPLDLDLLGLEVHLDRVVLDIDADPTGGLLGQLLCAVANLLDIGGPLADIVALLNQILALL